MKKSALGRYLARHQLYPFQIDEPPARDLGLAVVIPCHDEPDLLTTLDSLWRCERPQCTAEVLIVVNAAETAPVQVVERNRATLAAARRWRADHGEARLRFHLLDHPALPARSAGVGLARKLGMDEAVARLASTGAAPGVIVSLDADCTVDRDYLQAVEARFSARPETPAAAIYFEHPIAPGPAGERIARYELHLRYYVQGLRHAGSPFAFHTVGSCQAVRAGAYVAQGGMNRRRAGEDFYFVQKLIPLGGFSEINDTTVRPAARASHRVPFGTGRAMGSGAGRALLTYDPAIFADLKSLFEHVDALASAGPPPDLAPPLAEFLSLHGHARALAEIRANTAGPESFRKRWFRWFDGFRVMKYANFATRTAYPKIPVENAAARLLGEPAATGLRALLRHYRRLDREGVGAPAATT